MKKNLMKKTPNKLLEFGRNMSDAEYKLFVAADKLVNTNLINTTNSKKSKYIKKMYRLIGKASKLKKLILKLEDRENEGYKT